MDQLLKSVILLLQPLRIGGLTYSMYVIYLDYLFAEQEEFHIGAFGGFWTRLVDIHNRYLPVQNSRALRDQQQVLWVSDNG